MNYSMINGQPIERRFSFLHWDGCCDCSLIHVRLFELKHGSNIKCPECKTKISLHIFEKKLRFTERAYRDDQVTKDMRLNMDTEEIKDIIKILRGVLRKRKK